MIEAKNALAKLGNTGVLSVRLKAIIASGKYGIQQVCQVYDINRSSLHRWSALFSDKGIDCLKNIQKPSRSKLSSLQKEEVKSWVEGDSGITMKKLKIMIKEKFDIDIERSSIHRMFKMLGFSHITGRKRHYKYFTF